MALRLYDLASGLRLHLIICSSLSAVLEHHSSALTGYQKYNVVAKKLDRRLAALGAGAVVERGLGDDQHPSGYEAALDPWLASLWTALRRLHPLDPGLSEVRPIWSSMCACTNCPCKGVAGLVSPPLGTLPRPPHLVDRRKI